MESTHYFCGKCCSMQTGISYIGLKPSQLYTLNKAQIRLGLEYCSHLRREASNHFLFPLWKQSRSKQTNISRFLLRFSSIPWTIAEHSTIYPFIRDTIMIICLSWLVKVNNLCNILIYKKHVNFKRSKPLPHWCQIKSETRFLRLETFSSSRSASICTQLLGFIPLIFRIARSI